MHTRVQEVQSATGIPEAALVGDGSFRNLVREEPHIIGTWDEYSVAQKMFWASKRKTSRTEDMAYCLIGLFNINMPLLYGEGKRAFRRLQEEILKTTVDESIFAWDYELSSVCLLALSPSNFARGNLIESRYQTHTARRPSSTVNRLLQIDAQLLKIPSQHADSLNQLTNSAFLQWLVLGGPPPYSVEWFRLLPLNCSELASASDERPGSTLALVLHNKRSTDLTAEGVTCLVLTCVELGKFGFEKDKTGRWSFADEPRQIIYLKLW